MSLSEDRLFLLGLFAVLLIAAFIDLREKRIPNWLTFSAILLSLLFHGVTNGFEGLIFGFKGLLTGMAILIFPYLMGGVGAGDVKLMGAVGAAIGVYHTLKSFVYIALIGGIYALIILLFGRARISSVFRSVWDDLKNMYLTRSVMTDPEKKLKQSPGICFGVAISLGTILYFVADHFGFQILI